MEIRLLDSYFVYKSGGDEWPVEETPIKLFAAKREEVFCTLLLHHSEKATLSVGGNPAFSKYGCFDNYRVTVSANGEGVTAEAKLIGKVPDDAGWNTSDIVLNQDYIEMEGGIGQQVMILVKVDENALVCDSTVTVKVYCSKAFEPETLVKRYDIPLHVYKVLMPDVKDNRFHLDLWQHCSNIARKHDVMLWSEDHFAVLESYVKSLGELGQKAVTVIASEIPWSGQRGYRVNNYPSDLYEYSMIRVTKKDGVFSYDYSAMQRYIDLCFANGIDREIEVFGLINIWTDEPYGFGKAYAADPDGVRIRYYDADNGIYRYMDNNEDVAAYVAALERYFEQTNQLSYVQIVADEPADVEAYRASLNRLHAAAPKFVYKVAINHIAFIEEFGDYISDVVPTINFAAQKAEYLSARSKAGKGRTLLYVCCGPDYPNTFLASPAYEIEVITAFIHKIGIDGFLRWNYTVWPDEPRKRLSFRAPGWKAGDTNFVYPGNHGKALLSLRWYFMRRAIQNFALLDLAAKASPETVKAVYDRIFVSENPADFAVTSYAMKDNKLPSELYAQESGAYIEARKMLYEALEK